MSAVIFLESQLTPTDRPGHCATVASREEMEDEGVGGGGG